MSWEFNCCSALAISWEDDLFLFIQNKQIRPAERAANEQLPDTRIEGEKRQTEVLFALSAVVVLGNISDRADSRGESSS